MREQLPAATRRRDRIVLLAAIAMLLGSAAALGYVTWQVAMSAADLAAWMLEGLRILSDTGRLT